MTLKVAPYLGAWIETVIVWFLSGAGGMSHHTWVRGLKQLWPKLKCLRALSHHTWVRGLKPVYKHREPNKRVVAPYLGAWIETTYDELKKAQSESHHTWVRGLKHRI